MDNKKSKGVVDRKIENATTKHKVDNSNESSREKKMSTAQKMVPILIVVCVSLAIILMATLIAFFQLKADEKQNSKTLEAVYASSYFSMVDGINNLQVDSSKFETLKNASAQRACLKNMEQDCGYVLSGLSILPLEAESCVNATKFFNQINGMCEAYINKLDDGKTLSTDEIALVSDMGYVLGSIKNKFNEHNEMIAKVGYSFIDASVFNSKGINEFSTTLGSLNKDSIEYPTMIFDGPFSASLEVKNIKGLPNSEISKDEAIAYIKEKVFYWTDKVKIEYKGETNGDFVTYDFACVDDGEKYDVQITKRGGKLLTLASFSDKKNPVMKESEAIRIAEEYSGLLGFSNMKSVWHETKDNIMYINLAPYENEAICYPDLVKVKIDLGGQKVLGFEAQNYCLNHIEREFEASVKKDDVLKLIEGDYIIKSSSLAVIPLEDETEILTYEIVCEGIDGVYYFYVNANNEKIEKILKIVNQDGINKLI